MAGTLDPSVGRAGARYGLPAKLGSAIEARKPITAACGDGTHEGPFLGIAPTHRKIHFETVDVIQGRAGVGF
jgi:hypothetical protein